MNVLQDVHPPEKTYGIKHKENSLTSDFTCQFVASSQKPKLIFKTTVARRVKERNPDF